MKNTCMGKREKNVYTSHLSRRDFFKVIGQSLGAALLGIWGLSDIPRHKAARPTLIPWPSVTSSPVPTGEPLITETATIRSTPKPTYTSYPTSTPRPTHTEKPTDTPIPTKTPDRSTFISPDPDNFEQIAGLIATAINAANCIQIGKQKIDLSDLSEDYHNFSRNKYEQYKRGERLYKYLRMEEYRKVLSTTAETYVKATIFIPELDQHFNSEKRYLNEVLAYLHDELEVDTSHLNEQQHFFIARDIAENSQRFTCIKFLRLVWSLFGDFDGTGKGLFPQVYQARIKNAGELAYQILGGGGRSIFAAENVTGIRQSLIRNADAISEHPEKLPEFFDNKIMVYFRPPMDEAESGHVGVSKLTAMYDSDNNFKEFLITYLEVDGYTGQSHYGFRITLDNFRKHLYSDKSFETSSPRRNIGWLFNRS